MFMSHDNQNLGYLSGIYLSNIGFWYTLEVSILVTCGAKWRYSIVLDVPCTEIVYLGQIKNLV